jgi:aspartate/methionine/tyrosine aminotransferase
MLAHAQALEAQGRDIIHLEIGQPDIDTFEHIRRAGIEAIDAGRTRYTPPAGMPSLRHAIAHAASERLGMSFSAEEVVVTPGAKPNLFFPTLAVIEPGDEVLFPDPGFPSYESIILVAGGVPVPYPLTETNQFNPDLDSLRGAFNKRTRMLILNSPGNPTGGVLTLDVIAGLADAIRGSDCWVMSDDIYSRLHYGDTRPANILDEPGMRERTIVVDGFSKTFAMTGWRLGFGIMPVELARRVELLVTHATGSTAQFTQDAGIAALSGSQEPVLEMLERYRRRRDLVLQGLNAIPGVRCQVPGGAFYAFPNVSAYGVPSAELANRILDEAGVALLPGTAFGAQGEGYLRLSYASSVELLERGLARLGAFFSSLPLQST